MKSIVFAALFLFSQAALARQYIQCSILSDTSDVAVVNLTTSTNGTLFLSSGMENPEDERILLDIELEKKSENKHFFKIINAGAEGFIALPSNVIGKSSDSFVLELSYGQYDFEYACFSRLYNDE
jgi:hypothetical protein